MRARTIRILLPVLFALVLLPPSVQGSWMEPPAPYKPKDFAVLWHQGLFHLFYIRIDTSRPASESQRDFGHAVSGDLYYWEQLAPILTVSDSIWDNRYVWAPSVVRVGGVFYLFYTGVSQQPGVYNQYQRIGVATSTDLLQWNRMDEPVFSCVEVPWAYCNPLDALTGFRDPFVMKDPASPSTWLMYYVANPATDSTHMVVGVARSNGDFTQWTDLGPLWITHYSTTGSGAAESPHLFSRGGQWYLLFTAGGTQPLAWATGPDPIGAPHTWNYRGRLATMLGYGTSSWIASEHIRNGVYDYLLYVSGNRIVIKRMMWRPDGGFDLADPSGFRITGMSWSGPSVMHGDSVSLRIRSSWWQGRSADIQAVQYFGDGTEQPLSLSAMGLPSSIPLTADTTIYRWRAVMPPGDGQISYIDAYVIIRLQDGTVETPPLLVDPPRSPGTSPWEPGGPDELVLLRFLRRAPFGDPAAFLVELPAEGAARLDVFDLQGRRLRNLVDRQLPSGATVVRWDGRDATGAAVAPGVYFALLRTPWAERAARVLISP